MPETMGPYGEPLPETVLTTVMGGIRKEEANLFNDLGLYWPESA